MTRHSAAVGASGLLSTGGLANWTPESAAMASVTPCRVAWEVPGGTSLTTMSGPLKPGPKPSASRS